MEKVKIKNKVDSSPLREISNSELREWRAAPKSSVTRVFRDFLLSDMKMAEVVVDEMELRGKGSGMVKSNRQDRIASSFYAWKRKDYIKETMHRLGIENILLIRRGQKLALKKKYRNKKGVKRKI